MPKLFGMRGTNKTGTKNGEYIMPPDSSAAGYGVIEIFGYRPTKHVLARMTKCSAYVSKSFVVHRHRNH